MKSYCVDCMNFLTMVVHKDTLAKTRFNTKKIRNAVNKRGRAVIYWCRVTGAYYLNTHRVYELSACKEYFDDASKPPTEINIDIKIKGKALVRDGNYPTAYLPPLIGQSATSGGLV